MERFSVGLLLPLKVVQLLKCAKMEQTALESFLGPQEQLGIAQQAREVWQLKKVQN